MSQLYKRILAPIDGSKNSFAAFTHAAELARSFDAELGILYVSVLSQQLPVTSQIEGASIPEYSFSTPVTFAKKVIEEILKHIPEGIRVQTYNEIGFPSVVITEFAEKNNYDIIVIGSRGLGVLSRLVMGSEHLRRT